jgi:hypothetical protein
MRRVSDDTAARKAPWGGWQPKGSRRYAIRLCREERRLLRARLAARDHAGERSPPMTVRHHRPGRLSRACDGHLYLRFAQFKGVTRWCSRTTVSPSPASLVLTISGHHVRSMTFAGILGDPPAHRGPPAAPPLRPDVKPTRAPKRHRSVIALSPGKATLRCERGRMVRAAFHGATGPDAAPPPVLPLNRRLPPKQPGHAREHPPAPLPDEDRSRDPGRGGQRGARQRPGGNVWVSADE